MFSRPRPTKPTGVIKIGESRLSSVVTHMGVHSILHFLCNSSVQVVALEYRLFSVSGTRELHKYSKKFKSCHYSHRDFSKFQFQITEKIKLKKSRSFILYLKWNWKKYIFTTVDSKFAFAVYLMDIWGQSLSRKMNKKVGKSF